MLSDDQKDIEIEYPDNTEKETRSGEKGSQK